MSGLNTLSGPTFVRMLEDGFHEAPEGLLTHGELNTLERFPDSRALRADMYQRAESRQAVLRTMYSEMESWDVLTSEGLRDILSRLRPAGHPDPEWVREILVESTMRFYTQVTL